MDTFYRPFLESDSDTESDGYTTDESELPGKNSLVRGGSLVAPGHGRGLIKDEPNTKSTGTKFEDQPVKNSNLFMINSRDRDTNTYPQPTFFTLRLPRVFKNVKKIDISQLNLLNSFFNFAATSGNTYMYVQEQGRSPPIKIQIRDGTYSADDLVTELTNALNSTPLFADITLGNFINEFQATGNYGLLFNTPGQATSTIPAASIYDSLTQTYPQGQTINDIISRYFKITENVGTLNYSYNQALVAYYYPVMKEMIIANVSFDASIAFATVTDAYTYLVFFFTGLDDEKVLALASDSANQKLFEEYRYQNTFNVSLVNAYICKYNTKQGRLVINAPSLNASISSDLTTQYTSYLTTLVLGFTTSDGNTFQDVNDFNSQYYGITNSNSALISMYNFIQTRFTNQFGINFGTYSAEFYSSLDNEITLYNILNRYGWSQTLTPGISASTITSNAAAPQVTTLLSNIIIPMPSIIQSQFISTYAISGNLSFSNAGENTLGYIDVPFTIAPTTYHRITFNTQFRQTISMMTIPRYITNQSTTNDILYAMGPNTTPLLYDNRDNSSTFYNRVDISGNSLFNVYQIDQNMFNTEEYMRAENRWIQYMKSQILAGQRLQPGNVNYGKYPPINDIGITSYRPYAFFQVNAAEYLSEDKAHFNITFYVETQDGSNFPVPIMIVAYKDRAAFMADSQLTLNGVPDAENPQNYMSIAAYDTSINSAQMVVDVNNNQEIYFQVHIQGTAVPSSLPLRVFSLLTDVYGTYTIANRTDLFNMPYTLGALETQNTPASKEYQDPNESIYNSSIRLGYDISGVSNNLLDYMIHTGNNYYDPIAISDYIGNAKTGLQYQFVLSNAGAAQPPPSMSSWSLFFGSNSSNVILDTYNTIDNVYLSSLQKPKTILQNKFTLVNWFNPANPNNPEVYLTPRSTINGITNYSEYIGQSSIFLPAMNIPPLPTDASTFSNYEDINGFSGLSFFLEPNQIVHLDTLVLKFVYTQPSADSANVLFTRTSSQMSLTNKVNTGALYRNQTTHPQKPNNDWDDSYLLNRQNIKIGVFETALISSISTSLINLSNAITSLTLSQITQVTNYQYSPGTSRTREPDWGTYYKYSFSELDQTVWGVSASSFIQHQVSADFAPSFVSGSSTYTNYFLTNPNIINYSYLPRSFGIAPSVANSPNPAADVPNSYTLVPFVFNPLSSTYQVGCFHGLSFTLQPCLPSTHLTGASPYSGPMGPFGWEMNANGLLKQMPSTYYWNTKLSYTTLDLKYDPATDLSAFGGYAGISGELQDTMLFIYANPKETDLDLADVSTMRKTDEGTKDYWMWGQERNTNYSQYDSHSGYNNLSYLYNYTVRNANTYATHVRGYDPIPQFTTGVRFIGKNYTDFGALTFRELIKEIAALSNYTPITDISGSYYNSLLVNQGTNFEYTSIISTNEQALNNACGKFSHTYADALINFDRSFSTTQTFGKTNTFAGITYTFSSFSEAIHRYDTFFSTTRASLAIYNVILSTVQGQLGDYVNTRYGNILPSSIITRNRTTDPLPFSLLFSTGLVSSSLKAQHDEWGLGYNLGFNKADTPIRTTATSDTFIRIVQSYIYLRLNPELNLNTMAVSGKESLADCRESAGQEAKAFSKILLNNFGSFSSTAVIRPKEFNPVLGKYEVITCQLTDKYGNQLNSTDCEYDFVLQIDELTNGPKDSSSLLGTTSDLDVYKAR